MVGTLDGSEMYRETIIGRPKDAEKIGIQLADKLLAVGAGKILKEVYGDSY